MAEPYIGEIRLFSFGVVPKNWAQCNGQLLQITTNQALFAILGTAYGGDGRTTFALPNLQGRVPVCFGVPQVGIPVTLGQSAGEAAHTLVATEMPMHVHPLEADMTSPATELDPAGNFWGNLGGWYTTSQASLNTKLAPDALASAGGSQPHENRQPYVTASFCIALVGFFPSRN